MNAPQVVDTSSEKYAMLRDIFPEEIKQVHFANVDMDVSMLSIADILRNVNKSFPKNTSARNAIAGGTVAVAVLCRTKLLKPVKGLIVIISKDSSEIEIRSKDYIVLAVSENTIGSNEKILDMLDKFTTYLIQNYGEIIPSFKEFYTLFVYDAYELEDSF